jgi:hypothetical protein
LAVLILRSRLNPSPRGLNYAYHGLPAGMNVHVCQHPSERFA